MGNRTIERGIARKLYTEFSKAWRKDLRAAGKYGDNGFRKPTFSQWSTMHLRNNAAMAESFPADVREFMEMDDPWATPPQSAEVKTVQEERGVYTTSISGDDDTK